MEMSVATSQSNGTSCIQRDLGLYVQLVNDTKPRAISAGTCGVVRVQPITDATVQTLVVLQ